MAIVYFNTTVVYKGVYYPAKQEFKVTEFDLDGLISDGAVVVKKDSPKPTVDPNKLVKKTVDELIQFAEEQNIDLGNATKKADILDVILKKIKK